MRLVGLTGYAGSGKDTAAQGLLDRGWQRVAFADPLKKIAADIGWNGEKDTEGRRLLQNLGMAVRDHVHPDAWVWAAERLIESSDAPVVVTDVRFENEAGMIRSRGGVIVRVERPGVGPVNDHVSETPLRADILIVNDGTKAVLASRLAGLLP